ADVQDFVRDYLQAPFARIKELIAEFGAEETQDLIEQKQKSLASRIKDFFAGTAKPESASVTTTTTGGLTDDVKPITTPQERVAEKSSFAAAKAAAVGARDAGAREQGTVNRHEQER
ncbi:MAG: hypothetical protein RSC34_06080, partial [Alistipes sp.]